MSPEVFYSYLKKYFPKLPLADQQIKALLELTRFRILRKGEKLFFNSHISNLYLVLNGKLKLVDFSSADNSVFKEILHAGDIFGDITLLNKSMAEEYVEALTPNTIICFSPVTAIRKFIGDHPSLAVQFAINNAIKVKKLEKRYLQLANKDARNRLLCFFQNWAKLDGVYKNEKIVLERYLTLNDIASYLSTSRQTVHTLLKEFKDKGHIHWGKKNIELDLALWE